MSGAPTNPTNQTLTADDLSGLARLGIPPQILADAGLLRVTDAEARRNWGFDKNDAHTKPDGILFPVLDPFDGHRTTCIIRRDRPDMVDSKPKNKYYTPWGDPRHLYVVPMAAPLLKDPNAPIVLVESAKSALALWAWSLRVGMDTIPIATGGCCAWRSQRAGSRIAAKGERVDVPGPIADVTTYCSGHPVYVLFDSNTNTNPNVQHARSALVAELGRKQRACTVLVCNLPLVDGVNGPDDYIGICGDEAMKELFAAAHPPSQKPADAPAQKPAAQPLTADEAGTLTGPLLEMVYDWVRRFVIVTPAQAIVLAFWVLHTHAMDAAMWTPYLHITGPEKGIAKSLLMEVLADLCPNPLTTSGITAAALIRIIDTFQPTFFLDEIDTITKGDKEVGEAIRGILDAGFKRGGKLYKCVGKDNVPTPFNAFGPKCFGGIGHLADTVANRSIIIEMKRKLRSETIERRADMRMVEEQVARIKAELEKWGTGVVGLLKPIVPKIIEPLSDRANNVTEILLRIATVAGGEWLKQLTDALIEVYGADAAEDTSTGVMLLSDIRDIFAERGVAKIASKELASALNEVEGRLWAEMRQGKGISANTLARELNKHKICPHVIGGGSACFRGYEASDFGEVWKRYCTPVSAPPPSQSVEVSEAASLLDETPFSKCKAPDGSFTSKNTETRVDTGVLHFDPFKGGVQAKEPSEAKDGTAPPVPATGANGRTEASAKEEQPAPATPGQRGEDVFDAPEAAPDGTWL